MVRALLRLYPTEWRQEYGAELAEMLLARPLKAGTVGDIVRNGLWQRLRLAEPALLIGFGMMLLVLLKHPLSYGLYATELLGCGIWTSLRHGGDASKSARTAVKVSLLAGIPVMVSAAMLWTGVLGAANSFSSVIAGQTCWLRVSDPTSFWEPLRSATCAPAPLGLLLSPVFMLPQAWLWGKLGGRFGHWAHESF